MSKPLKGLERLLDDLAKQIAKAAIRLPDERFGDKVDALKALTGLQNVLNKAQPEEEGESIRGFADLLRQGAQRSGSAGDDDGPAGYDDEPDEPPGDTDDGGGPASGLNGVGDEAASPPAPAERNGRGVGGG